MRPVGQKQQRALSSLETDTRVGGLQGQGASEGWTVTGPSCAVPQLQPSLPPAEMLARTLQTTPTRHHHSHCLPVRSCQQSTHGAEKAGLGEAGHVLSCTFAPSSGPAPSAATDPASSSLGLSQNQPTEPSQRRPAAAERQPCSGDAPCPWGCSLSPEGSLQLSSTYHSGSPQATL